MNLFCQLSLEMHADYFGKPRPCDRHRVFCGLIAGSRADTTMSSAIVLQVTQSALPSALSIQSSSASCLNSGEKAKENDG